MFIAMELEGCIALLFLSLTLIDLPAVLDLGMFRLELRLSLSVTLLSSFEDKWGNARTELWIDFSYEPLKLVSDL